MSLLRVEASNQSGGPEGGWGWMIARYPPEDVGTTYNKSLVKLVDI